MNLELSDSQRQIQKAANEYAQHKLLASVHDRDEREFFDRELYALMAESGLCGVCIPKEYGGIGQDYLSHILAIEAIAKVDAGMAIAMATSISLAAMAIWQFGSETQKEKYLAPLARGEKIGAFAITEVSAGTDIGSLEMTALEINDHFVLNGTKRFITNAGEAEIYILFAKTGLATQDQGLSAFIVENDMRGLSMGEVHQKMGIRSAQVGTIHLNDVVIPKNNLLGKTNGGMSIALKTLSIGRIGVAAQAVGIAEAAYSYARNHAKERIQFGSPIHVNQGISFLLAEMKTKIAAARLLTYEAALLLQSKTDITMHAAMAKLFASDVAMAVTTDAVQILGGSGYMRNAPVERFMRDAKITQIYEGTNQAQKMVISKHLLRENC